MAGGGLVPGTPSGCVEPRQRARGAGRAVVLPARHSAGAKMVQEIKGIVNGKDRNGTFMYKVRYVGATKEEDKWVLPDEVTEAQIASFNKRKGSAPAAPAAKKQKAAAVPEAAAGGGAAASSDAAAAGGEDEEEEEEAIKKDADRLEMADDGIPVEKGAARNIASRRARGQNVCALRPGTRGPAPAPGQLGWMR
eukprot:SAG22_NODE_46_length_24705_cov_89.861010_3_plen_194_part_00